MFNMNPVEMIVIGIIALVVVGPRGLPEIGRMVGRWMKTFREAADEMKRSLYTEDEYPSYSPKRISASSASESESRESYSVASSEPKSETVVEAETVAAEEPKSEEPASAPEKTEPRSSRDPLIDTYQRDGSD